MRKLNQQVSYLPEAPTQGKNNQPHPIIGKNLWNELSIESTSVEGYRIVMISSPTCGACHHSLDYFFEKSGDKNTGFLCLTEDSEPEYARAFMADYSKKTTVLLVDANTLINLQMTIFPTFLVLESNGIVVKKFLLVEHLLSYLTDKQGKT
ncbi:hypothetical protein NDK47_08345 [Brevibacillus ruminantium]|uniref:Thioredoxin domain-containing protein n=1 Tax=Brevibacillus ruminantium TaxID=2950604 RepID=A0ABY4WK84_9BACL|nr:hypothetical protein [Brevibacillus ruminantium]USG67269.1 hypothetical protein NDK47_08345 [Brevibacillus ruminantium]